MIRRRGVLVPVDCRFEEFTPDIPENRLVKAAIRRLLMMPGVWQPTRRGLRATLAQFEPVGEDANPTVADRFRPNRLSRHYQALMKLAAIVVRATSLVDRAGTVGAESFLIDMNLLFQDFVTDRLRRHLTGELEVQAEPRITLDIHGSVAMLPDIVIRSRGERLLVADAKYKLLDDKLRGRHADYYQLLAYTTALDLDDGLLIYCLGDQAEGDDHLRTVTVRHAGKRLTAVRVDLSGPRSELEESMRSLAELVRSLANGSLGRHETHPDARWLDRNRAAS
jgi:5-methylcytosine-specific restriction enzyme subunit McrC